MKIKRQKIKTIDIQKEKQLIKLFGIGGPKTQIREFITFLNLPTLLVSFKSYQVN